MSFRLPDHATDASKRRAELAERLVETCPPDLADEIALVGSTAHGYADDDSDLELNLWAETIPPLGARIGWLYAAGASEIKVEDDPRLDNSYWIHASISNVPIEVGWQAFEALHAMIDYLLAGTEIDHLGLGYILINAIALRTQGQLQNWQGALSQYSDALQRTIINDAIENLSWSNGLRLLYRLAERGERLSLTHWSLYYLERTLDLLYAVNRQWMPSEKWTLTVAREFAPFDLDARIDAILGDPSLERRVELCAQLCLDVLALVPEQYDVSKAVEALKAGL